MKKLRRNSVHVALQGTIGRELVFRHFTNKVVVATPKTDRVQSSQRREINSMKMTEANHYAQIIMSSPELRALYEKYLREGETVYRKALKEYFEVKMARRA